MHVFSDGRCVRLGYQKGVTLFSWLGWRLHIEPLTNHSNFTTPNFKFHYISGRYGAGGPDSSAPPDSINNECLCFVSESKPGAIHLSPKRDNQIIPFFTFPHVNSCVQTNAPCAFGSATLKNRPTINQALGCILKHELLHALKQFKAYLFHQMSGIGSWIAICVVFLFFFSFH